MAKKVINSDIYNLAKLVDDVKSIFIPNESEDTLAISTYGYIGALESHRLQTQVAMTGELCNEVFPSRARLDRNVITHAVMTNIEGINAIPAKITAFLALRENDIVNLFDPTTNTLIIDRECPFYLGDFEFHLEYDIKLKKIKISNNINAQNISRDNYAYTAQYDIPNNRIVPTSAITIDSQFLNPPAVVNVDNEYYIYLSVILAQVEHIEKSKKMVTSNIVDNKTLNFDFENQLAYFEVHCKDSDEEYYLTPIFEGAAVPSNTKYYCWYQYLDSQSIRVRFDRRSYMPSLNTDVNCLIKTCKGSSGNFSFGQNIYVTLRSSKYGYDNITCLLSPLTDSIDGKDRKSKQELQALIPKESLSRGCLTTITDLNNYYSMIQSKTGRIVIQKKIDNQIERVYYAYLVAKDLNNNIIPSNTIDIKIGLENLIKSQIYSTDPPRYILPAGSCFRLGKDGIAYINDSPILASLNEFTPDSAPRGEIIEDEFVVEVTSSDYDPVSCRVDVGDCSTSTHVFPTSVDKRYQMIESDDITLVEDYIQMGIGKKYTYTASYTTSEANTIIEANAKQLDCFEFDSAYYIADGVTKNFSSLPIVAYGFPANTKFKFGITYRLNTKATGIIYFTLGNDTYKYNQVLTGKLSDILKYFNITGEVVGAFSSDTTKLLLPASGTITPPPIPPEEKPYTLRVSTEENLPDIKDREDNEWFYVIEKAVEKLADELEDPNESNVYNLTVTTESNLPPIEARKENDWFYVIESSKEINNTYIENNTTPFTTENYKLNVEKVNDVPAIEEREENSWWYSIVDSQFRKEIPDEPVVPTLTGNEYDVVIVDNFQGETLVITVAVDDKLYDINVTQDRHAIEHGITIRDSDREISNNIYQTFIPTLDQNIWPNILSVGSQIHYTLRYKASSIVSKPKVTITLSKGLRYVPLTNYVNYPDGTRVQLEPLTITAENKTEFIYTNPYAISINGARLYSAFYMMATNENPYLHFDYINDNSNIQFISTNISWKRSFTGNDTDQYTLQCTLVQSVQSDLGLCSTNLDPTSEDYFSPLVKLIAVFKRNGKAYRYRSMRLTSYDATNFSYTFTQTFNSKDILDNDNNIKVTNVQVAGQNEYSVSLSYGNKTIVLNNGEKTTISDIMNRLDIVLEHDISTVTSSNKFVLDVHKVQDQEEYEVISFIDFSDEVYLTIIDVEENEYTIKATCNGCNNYSVHIGDRYVKQFNIDGEIYASDILRFYNIEYETIKSASFSVSTNSIKIEPVIDNDEVSDIRIIIKREFSNDDGILVIDYDNTNVNYEMSSTAVEYGFFNPKSELKLYAICGIPDITGAYSKYDLESIVPNMHNWILTNIYDVVNGVTMYNNYSEIMGSRCTPYGKDNTESDVTTLDLQGYYIKGIPMFGYEYCQNELLAQNAIDALNYRKAYIDASVELLENSFGIDFKLFNTYGPSNIYYIIKDKDENGLLDDEIEFISRVNISLYFRMKLVSTNDSYTKNNIIQDIKDYIEDLDDISELHIPNLVTQITNNYSELIEYFEYVGLNDYGPDIQHLYRVSDNEIPIHTAPEFLNINEITNTNGTVSPDITIYISEV